MHDFLTDRGLRDPIGVWRWGSCPSPVPIPPSPEASAVLVEAFERSRHRLAPRPVDHRLDPATKVATPGGRFRDAFRPVPRGAPPEYKVPVVVEESGMCVDGWIPVNPVTLEMAYAGRLRRRRRDQRGHSESRSVRQRAGGGGGPPPSSPRLVGRTGPAATNPGRGICYLEFGGEQVALVEVTFVQGQRPTGGLEGPSAVLAASKVEFGASRVRRWFSAT